MPLAAPQKPHAEVLHQAQEPGKSPGPRAQCLGGSLQGKSLGSFLSLTDAVAVRIPLQHCSGSGGILKEWRGTTPDLLQPELLKIAPGYEARERQAVIPSLLWGARSSAKNIKCGSSHAFQIPLSYKSWVLQGQPLPTINIFTPEVWETCSREAALAGGWT